ncbi:MAG TPA: hypothetical protein VGJ26_10415 [Pirellulales bacterium]|jgi:hypothetical protein
MKIKYDTKSSTTFLFDHDVSDSQGRYVDLRKSPDRVTELPEAKSWPAFGEFLQSINTTKAFRTFGCAVSGMQQANVCADVTWVDVAFDDERLRWGSCGFHANEHFQKALFALNGLPEGGDLVIELLHCRTKQPDKTKRRGTRMYFHGTREQSQAAFGPVLDFLQRQQPDDYAALPDVGYRPPEPPTLRSSVGCALNLLAPFVVLGLIGFGIYWFFVR